jgi:dTMP kinase
VFVTLEGTAGTGKTTLLEALGPELAERGHDVTLVREFSATALGDAFEEVVETGDRETFDRRALSLTLESIADDIRKVETEVVPALRDGDVVVSERFIDRALVYAIPLVENQYGERDRAIDLLDDVEALLPVRPDLRVFLTLDRETRRARYRADRPELFDSEADIDRIQDRQARYRERVVSRENCVTFENDGSVAEAVQELADRIETV